MIYDPVIIIGAPRSGTSMLFHALRTCQSFWSLPSEGFHIWNNLCHPSLNNWKSEEYFREPDIAEKNLIITLYEQQIMPAWFWKKIDHSTIWKFNTTRAQKAERKLKGNLYITATKIIYYLNPFGRYINKRLLDKSLNNCLRLNLVNEVFPGAKYIYLKRNGMQSIQSLIRGWLNPDRFYTFFPPEMITISGYTGDGWKFVLPEGWRDFNNHHLSELCTWQWKKCHEKILDFKSRCPDKIFDVKLEELITEPEKKFREISDFIGVPHKKFDPFIKNGIPEVNKTLDSGNGNFPFPEHLEWIRSEIRPMMEKLGYD